MRKLILLMLPIVFCSIQAKADYIDHRGHNVDSLETVMAGWTSRELTDASISELENVAENLEELMHGFNQTNTVKSEYYARMLLGIAKRMNWHYYEEKSAKNIGQHFWAKEKYDSASFYYRVAMKAVESMSVEDSLDLGGMKYSQKSIDDALSQMYGSLGNLYSMMDSIDVAMEYYEKAGELFKKYGWNNSSSVLYYNMGETMRFKEEYTAAEEYYLESLKYSELAEDSLAIATAYKGLGSLYMEKHRTSKAMRYLDYANKYFSGHEKEELQFRMESLDYTEQVRALQNRRLTVIVLLMAALLLMVFTTGFALTRLKRTRTEKQELNEILEETVAAISPATEQNEIRLKPKEKEVLDLIAKGFTNTEIADAMCLSPETIKWYKRKLFAVFDVSNSAELIKIATDKKLL